MIDRQTWKWNGENFFVLIFGVIQQFLRRRNSKTFSFLMPYLLLSEKEAHYNVEKTARRISRIMAGKKHSIQA